MSKRKEMVPTVNKLASLIAELEGGKSESRIGDIRQILKLVVDMDAKATRMGMRAPLTMLRKIAINKARASK